MGICTADSKSGVEERMVGVFGTAPSGGTSSLLRQQAPDKEKHRSASVSQFMGQLCKWLSSLCLLFQRHGFYIVKGVDCSWLPQ